MIQAFTTAELVNRSFAPPKDPAQPKDYMPNWQPERVKPRQEDKGEPLPDGAMDDYRAKRAHLAALLERYQATGIADPYLVEIGLVHG